MSKKKKIDEAKLNEAVAEAFAEEIKADTSKADEIIAAVAGASEESAEPVEERIVIFEEALEAILFAAGHPISYATLARVFEMTPTKVKEKVIDYSLKYNDPSIPRGVILLTYGDSCQLCTKKYYLNEIRDALGIRKSGTLSTSSMEALAIVAYNQPVTRIFVDTLRRADSSYAMNNLIDRGLIEAQGRLDAPGRPMLYGTTPDFLRVFGLKDLSELPQTSEEITDMFAKGTNVNDEEGAVQEEMEFPELENNGIDASTNSDAATSGESESGKGESPAEGEDTSDAEIFDEELDAEDMSHHVIYDDEPEVEVEGDSTADQGFSEDDEDSADNDPRDFGEEDISES